MKKIILLCMLAGTSLVAMEEDIENIQVHKINKRTSSVLSIDLATIENKCEAAEIAKEALNLFFATPDHKFEKVLGPQLCKKIEKLEHSRRPDDKNHLEILIKATQVRKQSLNNDDASIRTLDPGITQLIHDELHKYVSTQEKYKKILAIATGLLTPIAVGLFTAYLNCQK